MKQIIEERIVELQKALDYYTKPRRISETFTDVAHDYYRSIPIRLNELGIEARSKAMNKFGIERCVDEYLKIYESVLK